MATPTQYSIDGGITWLDMTNEIRFSFNDASEDDDEMQDLQVVVTQEGMMFDLVGQESGEVGRTYAADTEYLTSLCQ